MVFGRSGLWVNAGAFVLGAAIVAFVGPRLSRAADRVGTRTVLGQTLAGALLLGASTSLPGLIVSVQTAAAGRANLAVANSLGGIAAQTLFIALADVALRSDTIEHENTLTASLTQSSVLITLLALLLIAMLRPAVVVSAVTTVHPLSVVVVLGVVVGFRTIQETRVHPSWWARGAEGQQEEGGTEGRSEDGRTEGQRGEGGIASGGDGRPTEGGGGSDDSDGSSLRSILVRYAFYVVVIGASGALISSAAGAIVDATGFSPVVMGLTLTGVATSLPELVTAVAAVRRGSVGLAMGDIVGGNAFDTVMIALADFVYARGSVFEAVAPVVLFVTAVALLMTGVLATGLIRRDARGFANIGVESYLIVAVYVLGIASVLFGTVVRWPL